MFLNTLLNNNFKIYNTYQKLINIYINEKKIKKIN